jgi:hypothetical protein
VGYNDEVLNDVYANQTINVALPWGKFPRIRIGDEFMLIPAGRSGVDFKLILKTPEPGFHYTIGVSYPSVSNPWQLPIYAEKTLETYPKAHNVIGRGEVNLQKAVESVIPAALPVVKKIDPKNAPAIGSEFLVLTPQLMGWFGSGQITVNERTLGLLQPVSYAEMKRNDFAIGKPVGVTGSGIVLHTASSDYSITFPPFDTLEERIGRAATLRKVNEYIEALGEDETEIDW